MKPTTQARVSVTISALPNEILSTILNNLPAPSLVTVACLSRRYTAVAERLLYSSVSLIDALSESSPLPRKTLRWCQSMRQRHCFIDSTKKLTIRWQALPNATLSEPLHPVCDELASVLRTLVHLEVLDIFLGPANLCPMSSSSSSESPGSSSASATTAPSPRASDVDDNIHAIERVISGVQLPLLQSCTLGAEWAKGVQPYNDTILSSFLIAAASLRHLKLPDHRDARLALPADALPYLSTFRGSADTAAYLLPGRPVHALSLVGPDTDVNRENLGKMTTISVPLRVLDLSAMSVRPILLKNMSTHFNTIEKLRVKLALRHTLHYSFTGIRLLAGLAAVLTQFSHLTFIDLSPTALHGPWTIGRANAQEETGLLEEWTRACPSIQRVIFPTESDWSLDDGIWTPTASLKDGRP
jgi:hypothetical protein